MRPGLHIGAAATIRSTVRPDMVATFDELGPVHPVYATWHLVRHMEEASRKLILPFLEPDEEAVGHAVEIVHLAPTLVGQPVEVMAFLAHIEGRMITCDVVAHSGHTLIGRGKTIQALLDKAVLEQRLAHLAREKDSHAEHPSGHS